MKTVFIFIFGVVLGVMICNQVRITSTAKKVEKTINTISSVKL